MIIREIIETRCPTDISVDIECHVCFEFRTNLALGVPVFVNIVRKFGGIVFLFKTMSFQIHICPLLGTVHIVIREWSHVDIQFYVSVSHLCKGFG